MGRSPLHLLQQLTVPWHFAESKWERFETHPQISPPLFSLQQPRWGSSGGRRKKPLKNATKQQREEKSAWAIQTHPHRLVGAEGQFCCLAVICLIVYIQLDLRVCSLHWLVLMKRCSGRKAAVDSRASEPANSSFVMRA